MNLQFPGRSGGVNAAPAADRWRCLDDTVGSAGRRDDHNNGCPSSGRPGYSTTDAEPVPPAAAVQCAGYAAADAG